MTDYLATAKGVDIMTDRRKAPSTIREHLKFLRDVQHPGSPFSEAQKHEAYVMQIALSWAVGQDTVNPTAYFVSWLETSREIHRPILNQQEIKSD